MADQALSKGEILNIRWSHEDPNPTAQRFEEHDMTRRAAEGIKEKSKELGVPDYMIDGHQEIEAKQHPYARIMEKDRQIIEGGKSAATDLSAQQQYFLQWAQFFAQQGIDPSQLDEQTIQYYQQYYASYYAQAYGGAAAAATPAPAPPPALLEATGAKSEATSTSKQEDKTDETKEEESKAETAQ